MQHFLFGPSRINVSLFMISLPANNFPKPNRGVSMKTSIFTEFISMKPLATLMTISPVIVEYVLRYLGGSSPILKCSNIV